MPEGSFNPLSRENLGQAVELALLQRPCAPLPPEPFDGAGLYALYYGGDFEPYAPVSSKRCKLPIYVGRAMPEGARSGKIGLGEPPGRVLHERLRQHANSIIAVRNLRIEDFRCRYLVVDDIWIPLAESLMIRHFSPLWNQTVSGFGIHAPGGKRDGGDRSEWDELHPGRPWYDKMVQARKPGDVVAKIATHFTESADIGVPPLAEGG